jgi:hypothetical protein
MAVNNGTSQSPGISHSPWTYGLGSARQSAGSRNGEASARVITEEID